MIARLVHVMTTRPALAAIVLGLLSALALPPINVVPVLVVCIPGLLRLIDARPGWRGAAWIGLCFAFGHHVAGLYWITEAILVEVATFWWLVPLAVPALAALLALFAAVPCGLTRLAAPGWPRVVVLAGGWVLSDLARQFVLSGFPWNPIGSVWAARGVFGDVMLQPAAWVGVHGLTLATFVLAALPLLGRRAMVIGVLAIVGWASWGSLRLSIVPPVAPPVVAVLVQGNIAQGGKWERARATAIFNRYLDLTTNAVTAAHRAAPDAAVVVIWPETASPFLVTSDANARAAISEASLGAPALIGAIRFDDRQRVRNSLVVVDGPGPAAAIYDKWHLVPFGEYQPGWFPLPIAFVSEGFAAGPGPATLQVRGIPPVGPLICYEAIFPGQGVASDRPAWLVNVTNDAWFGNSTGPRQHLAAARLRAVEEGLPLMRAANTGISAGFDAFGHELGRVDMNESGTLALNLPGPLPPTVFARFGLAIPAVLAGLLMALGFARSVWRRR